MMPDIAHRMTDEMLAKLEKQIKREYEQAAKEMGRKYREYAKAFREEEEMLKELVKAGEMSKADFKAWRVRHIAMGDQFTEMRDVLAADMEHANEIALGIARDQMPDVFALNANFAQYQISHDFQLDASFTLYDHNTAAYLLSEQRQLMPGASTALQKKIAQNKAMQWNQKKIQSAVLQGVLQGEGSDDIAKRLQGVAQMNYNSAVRYARTMTTNAQNAGRYEGYHKARDLGIDLTIEWQAILDAHTRHTHRQMHGQRRDIDEPFEVDGIKILYPAQSSGAGASTIPQSMIWNCRCTLLAWVKGFEGKTVKHSPGMGNMTFEEWQNAKAPKPKNASTGSAQSTSNVFALTTGKSYSIFDLDVREEKAFAFSDGTFNGVRKTGKATIYKTPEGIEFVFPKPLNKAHQKMTVEQLLNAYNQVPAEIRSRGQKQIIVHDVYNPRDSYWRKVYKSFSHSYMTGGNNIDVWRWDYDHDDDYLVRALSHEMAHWIDWDGGYPTGARISEGADWLDAMAKDLAVSGKKSPTRYGENASTEDFAESFAELVSSADFKTTFPNRYAIIVKILTS